MSCSTVSLFPAVPGMTRARRRVEAFSLVEMLVVLGIIGILLAIAAPLVPGLLQANQVAANVNMLSSILEEARESATAGNTYVWVAFTDPQTGSPQNGIWVATIQSQDGTEAPVNTSSVPSTASSGANWATTLTIPGNNLGLLNKIQHLPGMQVVDASKLPGTLTSQAPANATGLFDSNWTVTTLKNSTGIDIGFTHALEFTPGGEAHVAMWNSNIQFGLTPTLGASTNAALFNLSRMTGKATVYRP